MKLLNIYEALQELQISKGELLKLIDTNQISVIVDSNNTYYFTEGFIETYKKNHKRVYVDVTYNKMRYIPDADKAMLKNDNWEKKMLGDDD